MRLAKLLLFVSLKCPWAIWQGIAGVLTYPVPVDLLGRCIVKLREQVLMKMRIAIKKVAHDICAAVVVRWWRGPLFSVESR